MKNQKKNFFWGGGQGGVGSGGGGAGGQGVQGGCERRIKAFVKNKKIKK